MKPPRIALFSDSYHEANSVARTTRAIEASATRRNIPLLSVHAGPETRLVRDGSILKLDLKRSAIMSLRLADDLTVDLGMWRHRRRTAELLKWFKPDVLHFTSPGEAGQLGAYLGSRMQIPMVGSWHTNLHEHVSRRLRLPWISANARAKARTWAEHAALRWLTYFYSIPHAVLAPTRELAELIERRTGKPTFLMSRAVDTDVFNPARRRGPNAVVNIGYVGRLSADKSVRFLQEIEQELDSEGLDVRFTIVGDGPEGEWLRRHMVRADVPGVLRGDALADAYAQMDIFAFTSDTDAVGTVVLEAMASGVAVVAPATGGHRLVLEHGRTAILASDRGAFIRGVRMLVRNRERREAMGAAARAWALELAARDQILYDVFNAYDAAIDAAHTPSVNMTSRVADLLTP